jgi:hypothetical protein
MSAHARVFLEQPAKADRAACLEHILAHPLFRSLQSPQTPLKEYPIATELFHRPETFDPRLDSIVRVQMSRLWAGEVGGVLRDGRGRADPWRVEVPKGGHSVVFRPSEASAAAAVVQLSAPTRAPLRNRIRSLLLALSGGLILGAGLCWGIFRAGWLKPPQTEVARASARFWGAALHSPEEPLIIFSNAQFVGRPETGLRYARPGEVAAGNLDGYTGIGEVIAINSLNGLFASLHRDFVLKRAQLLNWDETKNRDLIFVGSPTENPALKELAIEDDFAFQVSTGS